MTAGDYTVNPQSAFGDVSTGMLLSFNFIKAFR